ncbi:hypothetical protein GR925_16940 [Streptomyces sp. HUCO-GS316]|uniref:hypothetical protein n=1 Tax=Streptomyces sp. HUCO-GS316 TaxID=2692198 RepID=UPI001370AF86|nr:hypothetical protein [Streptomyces sp. HUCO-GS316]MXM65080.1 hypothetical protein [Streptomyces sp. HUCO-GS316]
MSKPPQYDNGAYGADGTQGPPTVYHPSAPPAPEYEGYRDPAAAHGWQNAYDETCRLPRIPDGGESGPGAGDYASADDREAGSHQAAVGGRPDEPAAWGAGGPGSESDWEAAADPDTRVGRRARRQRARRRIAVAAGAAGAMSVAALVAGFSLSGSSGDREGKHDRTGRPTIGESETPAESAAVLSSGGAQRSAPASASTSADPSPSEKDTQGPSTTPSSSATPTPTPTASTWVPGNANGKPGRGNGKRDR